jgi:hypothetical protein
LPAVTNMRVTTTKRNFVTDHPRRAVTWAVSLMVSISRNFTENRGISWCRSVLLHDARNRVRVAYS